jgi:pimeloyl-ACP methyl ester carboxylesterase
MKNELISVETEDGIILHGALYEAPAAKEIAVIIQHGAAMNFYTGMGRFLPAILLGRGYSCLSANNRGHDFGTAPDNDKKPVIGLMRDTFKDCIKDVRALIAFMKGRGYRSLVLLGHSQAIPKIVYAQSQAQFPEVVGLILVSPPPSVTQMMRYLGNMYMSIAKGTGKIGIHLQNHRIRIFHKILFYNRRQGKRKKAMLIHGRSTSPKNIRFSVGHPSSAEFM